MRRVVSHLNFTLSYFTLVGSYIGLDPAFSLFYFWCLWWIKMYTSCLIRSSVTECSQMFFVLLLGQYKSQDFVVVVRSFLPCHLALVWIIVKINTEFIHTKILEFILSKRSMIWEELWMAIILRAPAHHRTSFSFLEKVLQSCFLNYYKIFHRVTILNKFWLFDKSIWIVAIWFELEI